MNRALRYACRRSALADVRREMASRFLLCYHGHDSKL